METALKYFPEKDPGLRQVVDGDSGDARQVQTKVDDAGGNDRREASPQPIAKHDHQYVKVKGMDLKTDEAGVSDEKAENEKSD